MTKKITNLQIKQMRELKPNHSLNEISDMLGINRTSVYRYTKDIICKTSKKRTVDYNSVLRLYFKVGLSVSVIRERLSLSRVNIVIRILKLYGEEYVKQNPIGLKRICYESQKDRNSNERIEKTKRSEKQREIRRVEKAIKRSLYLSREKTRKRNLYFSRKNRKCQNENMMIEEIL